MGAIFRILLYFTLNYFNTILNTSIFVKVYLLQFYQSFRQKINTSNGNFICAKIVFGTGLPLRQMQHTSCMIWATLKFFVFPDVYVDEYMMGL